MKKLVLTTLLGGMLAGGNWAGAQPPADSDAARPLGPGATASRAMSGSGTLTLSGDSPYSGGTTIVAGPNGPVVVGAGAGLPAATPPGLPAPGYPGAVWIQRNVTIRRAPGAPAVPPMAIPVQTEGAVQIHGMADGPKWISARATMAGKVEKASFLGVATTRPSATLRSQLKLKAGLVVNLVEPKSSAETAGLQVHDVIEKCDDQWLINPAQFIGLVRMYKPGESVTLSVIRAGERKKITAKLEERETYALADDDGNMLYTGQAMFDPNQPQGAFATFSGPMAGYGGPVQQITAGALGGAPLVPGLVATFGDDKQQILITIRNGHHFLTAKDPSGKEIFHGPIDTPDQRKALPQDVLKKLEEMEKIKVKIRMPDLETPGPAAPESTLPR